MDKDPITGSSHKHSDKTLSPDQEAFIARMKTIYAKLETNGSLLRELYDTGKTEELDDQIDEMATDLLKEDDEFIANRASLGALRNSNLKQPDAEKIIVARNRELLKTYRDLVVMESGLPDEARLNEIEIAKKTVTESLAEKGYNGGDPVEALHLLGIIDEHDDTVSYSFPEDLVPDSVTEKWCIYLASVIEHVNSEKKLQAGTGSQDGVMEADRIRTYAHNAVTADVHNVLGLEGDKKWAFKDTRQLLADIRDYVLPNDSSLTSAEAAQFCKDHHRGFVVSAALSHKK